MSDIREAFEKWIESRTGGHFAIEDYNDYSLDFACEAWQAALQSQTAPAVPEGLIDKIKREIGFANAGAESHKGRAGEQLRAICIGKSQALQYVLSMLDAAPQPDHSPDGGKVVPQVMGRVAHLDDGSVVCHLNSVGRALPDQTALYTHPAQSRNEVQAEALEGFIDEITKQIGYLENKSEQARTLRKVNSWLIKCAARLRQPSIDPQDAADRLRSNGGDV